MEKTILVIDDEKQIRKLLGSILKSADYRVLTGASAAEGKRLLTGNGIDLLVTDINMPEVSGFELIDHVKKNFPEIPIVVVTVVDDFVQAEKVLESGVHGYLVKPFNKNMVLITVANALRMALLEKRQMDSQKMLESEIQAIMDNLPMGLLVVSRDMKIIQANMRMHFWFGDSGSLTDSLTLPDFLRAIKAESLAGEIAGVTASGTGRRLMLQVERDDVLRIFQISVDLVPARSVEQASLIVMFEDQTEAVRLERELRQAQKLEAIGQLAAGIAHEINTPVQYIGDNIRFLADSIEHLFLLIDEYEGVFNRVPDQAMTGDWRDTIKSLQTDADIDFLREEIPLTVKQSMDGVSRVSNIVRAMKQFSHPGSAEKVEVDINSALQSTITVSRNEWKYGCELETDFDPKLPVVLCLPAELNQVFLNLIVNAAHAIDVRVKKGDYKKGQIRVETAVDGKWAVIRVVDNGTGIPENIRHRIYDPFFTTKGVGKGTGQGLAIARDIVVEKHGGTITCESVEGEGTIFTICLPLV